MKTFFVVEERVGATRGEMVRLYHEEIPQEIRPRIIWAIRLDTLPEADQVKDFTLSELYNGYLKMKEEGILPPSDIGITNADFYGRF